MQSQMMALLSLAEGSSVIVENVFENVFISLTSLSEWGPTLRLRDIPQ
jgi:UDP-N-acetylglucosamine 1-carboxyvinyltransferase